MSPAFLDELRTRTLLSGLISRTVKLTRAGREWKACCPFHDEKSPSFYVNDDKNFYHCFGCSQHGDAISWLTEKQGLPFMDAVKELAQAAGMDVPAGDPRAAERAQAAESLHDVMAAATGWYAEQLESDAGAGAREYLKSRGITEKTRRSFALGLAPEGNARLRSALSRFGDDKLVEAGLLGRPDDGREPYDRFRGRLMLPLRDRRGRVVAFSGRILGAGEPKYLNSPETPLFDKGRMLVNLDKAAAASRVAGRLIVVEGNFDVIALSQAGFGEVVAPLGTAVTETQLEAMWRLTPAPLLCFDGDGAGQKAMIRAALRALPAVGPAKTLRFVKLPVDQDPDDVIRVDGAKAFEALLNSAEPLAELLWQHEFDSEPLDTPEARAGLGKRLRDLTRTIQDEDVRLQYLALFNGMLDEFYSSVQGKPSGRTADFKIRHRSVSPELRSIARHGIEQAVFARATLEGLRRHPQVIGAHSEAIALMWIKDRQLAQVREAMLEASLVNWPLDRPTLETELRREGLAPALDKMRKANDIAFTFLKNGADQAIAERDLEAIIDELSGGGDLEGAIARAQDRYAKADEDDQAAAFRELERLFERRRTTEASFRDHWHRSGAEEDLEV